MLDADINSMRWTFLGGGIIAGVFIERLLKAGNVKPEQLFATDIRADRLEELKNRFGVRVSVENQEGAAFADVLVLALPPGAVRSVLSEVRSQVRPDVLVVSLAAAVPTRLIEDALEKPNPVLRVIPNTPSLIGRGMNPHCLGSHVGPEHLPLIERILALFGETTRIDEALMNVATALTAVGPTYVLPVIKALKDTARRLGMSDQDARFAASQTVLGTAQLVLETGKDPDTLKMMIGTHTLKEEEACALFSAALEAAYEKISGAERKVTQAQ
ncbi:MAG: pyrroline-5-carboxylate reductase [Acidobacteria bacterium]|nr:pyrroline-5-carboxylate reductase [Acidobacteriota bacterium]